MTDAHPHALLAATLDAGDRLVRALSDADADAVTAAVAEREACLAALTAVPRPARMPQAFVVRFHAQDAALGRALRSRLRDAEAAVEAAGRTRTGHARYGEATAAAPALLDTAPRHTPPR